MDENFSKSEEGKIQEFSNISLRRVELSDVDDFMEWATDDEVSRFCMWDTYTSKDQAVDFIKNHAIPHPWFRVICLENRAIGSISATPFSGFDVCRGELGYALAQKYWAKGIVTWAVKMVADAIFEEWPNLMRLQALVDLGNKRSQRVLEKAGFQREGILRDYLILKGKPADMLMFSLLRRDYIR